MAFI
jgi:hypothetical protein